MRHRLSIESLEDRRLLAVGPLTLEPVLTNFQNPLVATHAGDGSDRLFVAEQGGLVHIVRDGERVRRPFLDIRSQIITNGAPDERGLLGLAFHPDFGNEGSDGEGLFYVHYSAPRALFIGDHDSVIAEYKVSDSDPDVANVLPQRTILRFSQPFSNHNGGDLKFGPDDGLLYISSGDGGAGNDPLGNGQDPSTLLGAILRVDVNGDDFPEDAFRNYAIPPSNPFVNDDSARDEIFAFGFRNPYRMSFDDGAEGASTPDRLFVGDVGQSTFEEVNLVTSGNNYGWNVCEGDHIFRDASQPCPDQFAPPIAEYGRSEGRSVIGGFVYRGTQFPSLTGVYLFGDLNGTLMALEEQPDGTFVRSVPDLIGDDPAAIISFGEDESGELYALTFNGLLSINSADMREFDYGDAPTAAQSGLPASYPTLLPAAARHVLGSDLFLGANVDAENNGQPTAIADGDGGDEDGVIELASLVASSDTPTVSSFQVTASADAKLDAWIDFNLDGDWDDIGEQIVTDLDVAFGENVFTYTIPAGTRPDDTFARFRLSSAGGLSPVGEAEDGEVEDHLVTIIDGDAGGDATVTVPVGGSTRIEAADGNLSLFNGTTELFRSPATSLTSLSIQLTADDDQFTLPNLASLFDGAINIDAGDGNDELLLTGSGHQLDLTALPAEALGGFETIDLTGDGANQLTLDFTEVIGLSGSTDTLRLIHDEDDTLVYGAGWTAAQPDFENRQLTHLLTQDAAIIEITNTRVFQNPLDRFDANRSGDVTARDALQIINALDLRRGTLRLPLVLENPFVYLDVSGENTLSALDALQVINELGRRDRGESEEVVSRESAVDEFFADEDDEELFLLW